MVFTVSEEQEREFLALMDEVRLSRLRSGASSWELYRDGAIPRRFVEVFRVPTWQEHLAQHEGRLTALDQAIEEAARAYSSPPVVVTHLLQP